jgi:hypothetical protein
MLADMDVFQHSTPAISGSRPNVNHAAGWYRESTAVRGSTRGILSAHHKVDTGKDGFHLSLRDFADSLGQLPFIDGHKLRHIRDGITV